MLRNWLKQRRSQQDWEQWFTAQRATLDAGNDIAPPWILFPEARADWSGWHSGEREAWLHFVWLPFWRQLNPLERQRYCDRWQPSLNWQQYLEHWQ